MTASGSGLGPRRPALVLSDGWNIVIVNRDGTGRRRLTRGVSNDDWAPAWSPDGPWIAFTRNGSLYRMRTDGSGLKFLGPGDEADWSPNGKRIVFTLHRVFGGRDIYSMRTDGTHRRLLTRSRADEYAPAWSPGGTRIAYTRGFERDVWVMNADGSNSIGCPGRGCPLVVSARRVRLVHENAHRTLPWWRHGGGDHDLRETCRWFGAGEAARTPESTSTLKPRRMERGSLIRASGRTRRAASTSRMRTVATKRSSTPARSRTGRPTGHGSSLDPRARCTSSTPTAHSRRSCRSRLVTTLRPSRHGDGIQTVRAFRSSRRAAQPVRRLRDEPRWDRRRAHDPRRLHP